MAKDRDDANPTTTLSLADLIDALRALKGSDDETLQKRAQYEAEAHARLTHRENEHHPGKSVYSYPEGDVARPKPALKCKMYQCGYDLSPDTITPEEIDLLNQLTIGAFTFKRTDGSEEKLTVTGELDPQGQPTRLLINYPCKGELRHNLPSLADMLRAALGRPTPELVELAALRAELDALKATR